MSPRKRQSGGARRYPRTARVNELVREILAEELDRIDDDDLGWVTITAVEIVSDLNEGVVFYSSLNSDADDELIGERLAEHRPRLQKAIASQARMRRTPELSFRPDSGVVEGSRIETILAELRTSEGASDSDDETAAPGSGAAEQ